MLIPFGKTQDRAQMSISHFETASERFATEQQQNSASKGVHDHSKSKGLAYKSGHYSQTRWFAVKINDSRYLWACQMSLWGCQMSLWGACLMTLWACAMDAPRESQRATDLGNMSCLKNDTKPLDADIIRENSGSSSSADIVQGHYQFIGNFPRHSWHRSRFLILWELSNSSLTLVKWFFARVCRMVLWLLSNDSLNLSNGSLKLV